MRTILMKIVVTGATGFIGRPLCAALTGKGHSVTALSRDAERAQSVLGSSIPCITWGKETSNGAPWECAVAESDAIVHLAGEPVAERAWSTAVKAELVSSR